MDIGYEPRADHLLVKAGGRFDADRCRAALVEIRRICEERRLARVLVDFRGVIDLVSISDRFDLGKLVAESNPGGRMAILVTPPQRHTATLENTAVNRGAAVRTTAMVSIRGRKTTLSSVA